MKMSVDGYDVEVIDNVSKDFYCVICTKLMKDAIQMECGDGMCNGCFQIFLKSSKQRNVALVCPSCRTDISEEKIVSVPMLNRIIPSLKVKCSNTEHGCVWVGTLGDMKDHLLLYCEYKSVVCSFANCHVKVLRLELADHEEICEYRVLTCEYCSNKVVYKTLSNHIRNCEYYPLMCPIPCCNEMLPQYQMTDHLSDCPFDEVECPYHTIGCSAMALQKDLNQHFIKSAQSHLMLMMNDNLKNKEIIANLQNDLAENIQKVDDLQNDSVRKTHQIDHLQNELNGTKTLESVTKELENIKLQGKSSINTELFAGCNRYINEMCNDVEEVALKDFENIIKKLSAMTNQKNAYEVVQEALIDQSPFAKCYTENAITQAVKEYIINLKKIVGDLSIDNVLRSCRNYFSSSANVRISESHYMDDIVVKLKANIEKRYLEIFFSNCNLKKYDSEIKDLEEYLMKPDQYLILQDDDSLDLKNYLYIRHPLNKLDGFWRKLFKDQAVLSAFERIYKGDNSIILVKNCKEVWLLGNREKVKAVEGDGYFSFGRTLKDLKYLGCIVTNSVVFKISK